ncbi:hypothetical protein [Nonomuraea sp. NPDC050643]|uniref:hypothetical protein n=1 Tax=Nonomuraea sp. NPDC050643 TaxID=3155660 RepID=UPI0033C5C67E
MHRVDAEQAAGAPIEPIPGDLAADGIDEVLVVFLAHVAEKWPEELGTDLTGSDGRAVAIDVGDGAALTFSGPAEPVERLRALLRKATQ